MNDRSQHVSRPSEPVCNCFWKGYMGSHTDDCAISVAKLRVDRLKIIRERRRTMDSDGDGDKLSRIAAVLEGGKS